MDNNQDKSGKVKRIGRGEFPRVLSLREGQGRACHC